MNRSCSVVLIALMACLLAPNVTAALGVGAAGHPHEATVAADANAFITVADFKRQSRSGERMHLVDPRPRSSVAQYSPEAALALHPVQVRTQTQWRRETVVLVGSGAAYQALLGLRRALLDDGFERVFVLDGGARMWQTELDRRRLSADELLIDADAIDLALDAERWTVVDLSGDIEQAPAGVELIEAHGRHVDALSRELDTRLRSAGLRENILVVASDSDDSTAAALVIGSRVRANVFALRGGWTRWLRRERIMAQMRLGPSGYGIALKGGQCW